MLTYFQALVVAWGTYLVLSQHESNIKPWTLEYNTGRLLRLAWQWWINN